MDYMGGVAGGEGGGGRLGQGTGGPEGGGGGGKRGKVILVSLGFDSGQGEGGLRNGWFEHTHF